MFQALNPILQRAAPMLQRLGQQSATFGRLSSKLPEAPDIMPMPGGVPGSSPPTHDANGVPQPAPRPDDIVNGSRRDGKATFAERWAPAVPSFTPNGMTDLAFPFAGGGPTDTSAARAFPTPIGEPQGNPFPTPLGIAGYNPNVGDMADPTQLPGGGDGMRARQVLDPATGQMMNDIYSKSFPPFFQPNFG